PPSPLVFYVFFFTVTATTYIYTLSLHDALPISNDAFINDPSVLSDKRLDTPGITITQAGAQVSFRNNYALEPIGGGANFFDGAVDRKSTRLNSSHVETSYAAFCVKKRFVTGGYN